MSTKKRSDSSLTFRTQLKRDYVIVPDITNRVDIDRYVQIAKIAQDEAGKSVKRHEYSRAYIDLNKFLLLVSKIASHASYPQRSDIKKWAKIQSDTAFLLLEDIVSTMDKLQDKIVEEEIDRKLMAAFDHDEEDNTHSTPHHHGCTAAVVAVECIPSTPVFPAPIHQEPFVLQETEINSSKNQSNNTPATMSSTSTETTATSPLLPLPTLPPTAPVTTEDDPFAIFTTRSTSQQINAVNTTSTTIENVATAPISTLPTAATIPVTTTASISDADIKRQKLLSTFFVPEYEGQLPPSLAVPGFNLTDNSSTTTSAASSSISTALAIPSAPSSFIANTSSSVSVSSSTSSATNIGGFTPPIVTILPSTAIAPSPTISSPTITSSSSSSSFMPSSSASASASYSLTVSSTQYQQLLNQYKNSSYSSPEELYILQQLYQATTNYDNNSGCFSQFSIPMPASRAFDLYLSPTSFFPVFMDDFHASFSTFLQAYALPAEIQVSRAAMESNRCLFLHLGVATQTHPYLLQVYFRHRAWLLLQLYQRELQRTKTAGTDGAGLLWYEDILQSVLLYAGLVDANVLTFLWPREWNQYRICFISGQEKPIFSVFEGPKAKTANQVLKEVIVHCNGSHFTLIRPRQFEVPAVTTNNGSNNAGNKGLVTSQDTVQSNRGFQVINRLLQDAEAAGLTVQRHTAFTMPELAEMSGISQNNQTFITPYPQEAAAEAQGEGWMPSIVHTIQSMFYNTP